MLGLETSRQCPVTPLIRSCEVGHQTHWIRIIQGLRPAAQLSATTEKLKRLWAKFSCGPQSSEVVYYRDALAAARYAGFADTDADDCGAAGGVVVHWDAGRNRARMGEQGIWAAQFRVYLRAGAVERASARGAGGGGVCGRAAADCGIGRAESASGEADGADYIHRGAAGICRGIPGGRRTRIHAGGVGNRYHHVAGGLTLEEIRSAVLLGLLGFVIYPIIPNRFVDPWQLVNPRTAWVMVIVIAGIGFVNYVLLKLYGTRGIYVSGFLGGLVNSTAAAAELAKPLGAGSASLGVAIAALLLTIVAIFSPAALAAAAAPLIAMAIGALVLVRRSRARAGDTASEIHLESPVSLMHVLNFAVLFLVIQVLSTLGERHLGKFGFLGISLLGGLVSSASTTAAAANMVSNGQLQPGLAGTGVVLASIASALINLPIVARGAKNGELTQRLVTLTVGLVILGIAVLILREYHWLLKI